VKEALTPKLFIQSLYEDVCSRYKKAGSGNCVFLELRFDYPSDSSNPKSVVLTRSTENNQTEYLLRVTGVKDPSGYLVETDEDINHYLEFANKAPIITSYAIIKP